VKKKDNTSYLTAQQAQLPPSNWLAGNTSRDSCVSCMRNVASAEERRERRRHVKEKRQPSAGCSASIEGSPSDSILFPQPKKKKEKKEVNSPQLRRYCDCTATSHRAAGGCGIRSNHELHLVRRRKSTEPRFFRVMARQVDTSPVRLEWP